MARAGDTIYSPVTGETTTFLETAADTDGRLLRIEMTADPRAAGATAHLHPRIVERHHLQEGRLAYHVGGVGRVLEAGGRLEIPAGVAHDFRNPDDAPARVVVEYTPAGRFEDFMETIYALARDGKLNAQGRPTSLLQAAVIAQAHLDDVALPRIPLVVQRVLYAVLAPIGRWRGYRSRHP
jgi:mannose-6-phosphate isomerase-like protein (cupin superfamily)